MARLIVRDEKGERTFELIDGRAVVVGRSEDTDLPVADAKCSRAQCQLERVETGWKIVDLESRNGTKVNGKTVNQHLLAPGDRIEIGAAVLEFRDESPERPSPRITPKIKPPSEIRRPPTEVRKPASDIRIVSAEDRPRLARRASSSQLAGTIAIVVGVALGAIFLIWVVKEGLTGSMHEEWNQQLTQARALVEVQPDRARDMANRIPPEAGQVYRDAQALIREIDDARQRSQHAMSSEMTSDYNALRRLRENTNHYQEMLDACGAFEERWGAQMYPALQADIAGIRGFAREGIDRMREVDLTRLRNTIESMLQAEPPRFRDAAAEFEGARPTFEDSPEMQDQVNALFNEIMSRADAWYTEQESRAIQLEGADARAAAQIYEEMLQAFGRDTEGPFRHKVMAIQGRLDALQP